MKARFAISVLLLTFVLAGMTFSTQPDTSSKVTITPILGKGPRVIGLPSDSPKVTVDSTVPMIRTQADSIVNPKTAPHKIIAYYFHGNVRCVSCRKIEAYSKEAIDSGFADLLKSQELEWRVVNTDESENEHFLEDYQLYTKSLIIVDMHGDKQTKWKNLTKVWELLGDKAAFIKYVQDEIKAYLEST